MRSRELFIPVIKNKKVFFVLILVIILAPKAQNLTQNRFELSPQLLICSCIYEGVYGATEVNQEPVCQVIL